MKRVSNTYMHSGWQARAPYYLRGKCNSRFLLSGTLAIFLYSMEANASDNNQEQEEKSDNLEEILITGLKREINRKDYAGSINVLTSSQLQNEYVTNITDIALLIPGLHTQDTGARNPTPVVIRGINFDGISSNDLGTDGTTVTAYVDDIPLQGYYSPPQFMLKDLQRVEVIRGPQSTLYGASALTGLIHYETAKPKLNELSLQLHHRHSQTSHSSSLNTDTDIIANVPIIDDVLALRALVSSSDNAGFIDNDFLATGAKDDINREQVDAARVSLLFQPSNELSMSLMAQKQKTEVEDRQADNPTFTGEQLHASSHLLQPVESDLNTLSFGMDYDFEQYRLEFSASHYRYDQQQETDLTDLYFNSFGYPEGTLAIEDSDVDVSQNTVEIKWVSQRDGALNAVAGLFYSNNDLAVTIDEFIVDESNEPLFTEFSAIQGQKLKDYSLFGEANWSVTEKFDIRFGGRYFSYEDSAEACSSFAGDPLACEDEDELYDDDDNISANISGLFKVNEHTRLYLSLSEGFRRGGLNPGIPDSLASRRTYDPDTTLNYEIGLNSSLWQNRIQLNTSLFYIDWKDIQIFSFEEAPDTGQLHAYIANVNRAESEGVEIDISAQITDNLSWINNYSYNNAVLSEDAPSYNDADGFGDNGFKDDRLPGSPKHQFHSNLVFEQKAELFGVLTNVQAALSLSHVSGVTTQLNDTHIDYERLDSYSLINTRLAISRDSWKATLFARNLTNKRAVTGSQGDFFFGQQGAFEYITRPRTIGIDLSYRM